MPCTGTGCDPPNLLRIRGYAKHVASQIECGVRKYAGRPSWVRNSALDRGSLFYPFLGTILADVVNQVLEGLAIMNEITQLNVRISNWTLATGTRSGERDVRPGVRQESAPPPAPETWR